MIECLDDYTLSDYINHSLSYFAHKLDVQNGDNNFAMTIFRLIEEQRTDYFDNRYEREQETYYPIYDYLCKMYLNRYAKGGESEDKINQLIQELIERDTYDVPGSFNSTALICRRNTFTRQAIVS